MFLGTRSISSGSARVMLHLYRVQSLLQKNLLLLAAYGRETLQKSLEWSTRFKVTDKGIYGDSSTGRDQRAAHSVWILRCSVHILPLSGAPILAC